MDSRGGSKRFRVVGRCAFATPFLVAAIAISLLHGAVADARVEVSRAKTGKPRPPTASAAPKAPCRLFAFGDLHGDLGSTLLLLQGTGLTDDRGRWKGGCATLIQVGDVVDRGYSSVEIIDLFESLKNEARMAGGEVVQLIGNHELMNLMGDFSYVNPLEMERHGGFSAWSAMFLLNAAQPTVGRYADIIRRNPTVVLRNKTVFVHAGIVPEFAQLGVDGINRCVRSALAQVTGANFQETAASATPKPCPSGILEDAGPFWTREIIAEAYQNECSMLRKSLELLGAKRMVVGHTIQRSGVSMLCKDQLIAIDVGNSRAISGNRLAAVEFAKRKVRVHYITWG